MTADEEDLQALAGKRAVAVQRACAYDSGEKRRTRFAGGILDPNVMLLGAISSTLAADPESVVVADFPAGSAELPASTIAELRGSWIGILESQTSRRYEMLGFTDCVGDPAKNAFLRERRAQAVARLFPATAKRSARVGAGPATDFVTRNGSPQERALNRAVVLRLPPAPPPPPAKREKTITKRAPVTERCSSTQRDQLSIAFPAARVMIEKAIAVVPSPDKDPVAYLLLERYFGKDARRHLPEILAGYRKILSGWKDWDEKAQCHLQTDEYCVSDDPHKVVRAYAWQGKGDVHVCAKAFEGPGDMQQLSATIVHELSHRLNSTNDHSYCPSGCSLSTEKAIDNADSYAQFAREIFNASL